jgi:hypothetical protein
VPKNLRAHAELEFLTAVERGEVVTQKSISKRIGVAVGLINALLKRSMVKGYVKARQAPYKRYAYYLTPEGFTEKSRLVGDYLQSSLEFFRKARGQYTDLFQSARGHGYERLVIVGGGELAEIAVLAATSEGVHLVAIVDPTVRESSRRFGVAVKQSIADIEPVDVVVIADERSPQAIYEELRRSFPNDRIMAPALLRITPDRDELIIAATRGEKK